MIVDDILKILELNKKILCQFIGEMTEAEINNRIKNYWTIYEHLEHLTFGQKIFIKRMKQFIKEESPIIEPSGPENLEMKDKKYTVKELLKKFCDMRNEEIKIIKKQNKNIWKKEGKHKEYKKYTFEILIRHAILHDSFHMWRMEELWIEKEEYIKIIE